MMAIDSFSMSYVRCCLFMWHRWWLEFIKALLLIRGALQTRAGQVHPWLVQRRRPSLSRHHGLHEKSWSCYFRGGLLCSISLQIAVVYFLLLELLFERKYQNALYDCWNIQIYGMTENPNNNANYFDPAQGHGRRFFLHNTPPYPPHLTIIIYEWQHSCRSSYSWSCQGSESDPPSAGSSKAALDDRPLVVKQSCIFKILPMV